VGDIFHQTSVDLIISDFDNIAKNKIVTSVRANIIEELDGGNTPQSELI